MARYVTDTHPLLWHLTGDPHLTPAAQKVFAETDQGLHTVWVPAIVLVEAVYVSEKKGIPPNPLLAAVVGAPNYRIDPLDGATLTAMLRVPRNVIKDMPDRIITATSLKLGLPLITADANVTASGLVTVVW